MGRSLEDADSGEAPAADEAVPAEARAPYDAEVMHYWRPLAIDAVTVHINGK